MLLLEELLTEVLLSEILLSEVLLSEELLSEVLLSEVLLSEVLLSEVLLSEVLLSATTFFLVREETLATTGSLVSEPLSTPTILYLQEVNPNRFLELQSRSGHRL